MANYTLKMGDHLLALRLRGEGRNWSFISERTKIPVHLLRKALEPKMARVPRNVPRETIEWPNER